jgi:cobalt-zinc-cadmium efflux system outer membrane protein
LVAGGRLAVPLLAVLSGCRAPSTAPDDSTLHQIDAQTEARVGLPTSAASLLATRPGVHPEADAPLTGTLTREHAVVLALARNLALVASAEDVAIAQAQLVQAGLLPNPTLGQNSGFIVPIHPRTGRASVDVNLQSQGILNALLTRPTRVKAAEVQRAQSGLQLSSAAFDLALQVGAKYDELVHLRRAAAGADEVVRVYERSASAAEARLRVGVVPRPEANRARLQADDARRQAKRLRSQFDRAARELHWMMGCSGPPAWTLDEVELASATSTAPLLSDEDAQDLADGWRLDLERARLDGEIARANVALAKLGKIPLVNLGPQFYLDSAGAWSGGLLLASVTLPILDSGQTGVDLAEAVRRKTDKSFEALREQSRQDARTALANASAALDDMAFMRDRTIPQQAENVDLAEKSFEAGLSDLDSLLNVLHDYAAASQSYEDSVSAYHAALVDLQRATGVAAARMTPEMVADARTRLAAWRDSAEGPRDANAPADAGREGERHAH